MFHDRYLNAVQVRVRVRASVSVSYLNAVQVGHGPTLALSLPPILTLALTLASS